MAPAKKKSTKAKPPRSVSDRLIDAALELAADEGWSGQSLPKIAARAGVPIGDALLTLPSRVHILNALTDRIDAKVFTSLEQDPLDGSTKDKLFDVLMRRFDALGGHRDAMASISKALRRDPISAACVGTRFLKSMALSLQAAGVSAEGCQGALKAKVLAAIQLNAFRAWLDDDDPGMSMTMSTLDKDLRRAENFVGRFSRTVERDTKTA